MTHSRHPFKALVALAAMAALTHGMCARADTPADDVSRVDVVGTLPLRDACTVDDGEIADELAPAWESAPHNSSVTVDFKVQGHHVYDVTPHTPSWYVLHQIRHVVHGLRCDGGDDRSHAVRFVVRFIDEPGNVSRTASIAIADGTDR